MSILERFSTFEKVRCPTCRKTLRELNVLLSPTKTDSINVFLNRADSLLQAKCSKCKVNVCLVCGETADGVADVPVGANAHCAGARLIAISQVLQFIYFHTKLRSDKSDKFLEQSKGKVDRKKDTTKPQHKHQSAYTQIGSGTGYASHSYGRKSLGKASKKCDNMDEITSSCVIALKHLLPNAYRQPEAYIFDHLPDPDLCSVLTNSCFLIWMLEYLQNDSLMDIADRSPLYFNIISLLDLLSKHEILLPILIDRFPEPKASVYHDLPEQGRKQARVEPSSSASSSHQSQSHKNATQHLEYTIPLIDAFGTLVQQTSIFSQSMVTSLSDNIGISAQGQDEQRMNADQEEMVKVVTLATDFNDLWGKIQERVAHFKKLQQNSYYHQNPIIIDSDSDTDADLGDAPTLVLKTYAEVIKPHLFQYVQLWSEANPAPPAINATQVLKPNRTIHIAKELATLSTSLPCCESSSIFVRVDGENLNAIRFVITGPTDTPYSNACFVLNTAFPNAYPDVPPRVTLLTTGNGSVRFNPNLYHCGKVCLSLLGTWLGAGSEMWQTGKNQSTLLQVLMSIQSMILIDTPYYNEPGDGKADKTSCQNTLYNRVIRRNCVKEAMIGILRNPPVGFKDVVRDHFRLKKDEIMKQVREWSVEDWAWDGTHYLDAISATRATPLPSSSKGTVSSHWKSLISDLQEELSKLR
ncbi:hypothetical protein DFS34DRAFT_614845 [Phlyctochytrium arcticum]|nr:hypothetical protein DFS34DRAFT_614845 [Phlyctochytrium arcticum]